MSIYDAIANSGNNAGAGISNYFTTKYQLDRTNMLDKEAQDQNAFVRKTQLDEVKQRALDEAAGMYLQNPDAAFALLDSTSDQWGIPRVADKQQLGAQLEARAQRLVGRNGIVGSPLRLGNGNYGYLNERGKVVDTGSPFAPEVIQLGGGGLATYSPGMQGPQTVVPPSDATQRDAARAAAITGAQEGAQIAAIPRRVGAETTAQVKAIPEIAAAERESEAAGQLPTAQLKTENTISVIQKLRNHPGRGQATGKSSMVPILAGTDAYDFMTVLKQAQGGVFLEAYQMLKGGGAITAIEGEKGEQAMARMDAAQTEEGFLEALDDYESAVISGLAKLERAGRLTADGKLKPPKKTKKVGGATITFED